MTLERLGAACFRAVAAAGALVAAAAHAETPEPSNRLGATYTSDSIANFSGGLKSGFSQMGLLELTGDARGEVFGIKGVEAHVSAQWVHGRSLSATLVGDAQVSSNIDAPGGVRLFEAWLLVPVARDAYVKAGLIDLNSEFDLQETGALFLSSSHGIGPEFSQSGLNGPSIFPTTASAVMASVARGPVTVRAGLFDSVAGDPDRPRRTVIRAIGETGLLVVAEAELRLPGDVQLQAGTWRYTNRFDVITDGTVSTGERRRGNRGAYILAEGRLGAIGGWPVNAWVRAGRANRRFNSIEYYLGGGMAVGREGRAFGLAIAHARQARPARMPGSQRSETILEATYAHAFGDLVTVQPDIQMVLNPGFARGLKNALSAGVRVQFTIF